MNAHDSLFEIVVGRRGFLVAMAETVGVTAAASQGAQPKRCCRCCPDSAEDIQVALDALPEWIATAPNQYSQRGGGLVVVAAGEYELSAPLRITKSNTTLWIQPGALLFSNDPNVTLIEIDADDGKYPAVFSQGPQIDDVTILLDGTLKGAGIAGSQNGIHCRIDYSDVFPGWTGNTVNTSVLSRGGSVVGMGNAGFVIHRSVGTKLDHIRCRGNLGRDIVCERGPNALAKGRGTGTSFALRDCICSGAPAGNVHIEQNAYFSVLGGVVEDSATRGMLVEGCRGGVVAGVGFERFTNPSAMGLHLIESACEVLGNYFIDCERGIVLEGSKAVRVGVNHHNGGGVLANPVAFEASPTASNFQVDRQSLGNGVLLFPGGVTNLANRVCSYYNAQGELYSLELLRYQGRFGHVGTLGITAGNTASTVECIHVRADSLIFVTQQASGASTAFRVTNKVPGESFDVEIDAPAASNLFFFWMVVNKAN